MKTIVMIDGPNLYTTMRMLQGPAKDIDFRKLRDFLNTKFNAYRIYFYTAVLEDDDSFQVLRPLLDWLTFNGFTICTKVAKEYKTASGPKKIKGNMDVEIAVDMLTFSSWADTFVLFSGDGDFTYAVQKVQEKGGIVQVVSSLKTSPPLIADSLRRQADKFIELADICPEICRAK